jgi:hypothetical protein
LANQPKAFYINGFSVFTDAFEPIPQPIHRLTFEYTYDAENNIYGITSTITFYVADPEPLMLIFVSGYVSF